MYVRASEVLIHSNLFGSCSEKEDEENEVEDMEVENSIECKISLNSYKMVFVKGSEDFIYRRSALRRAKQVGENDLHLGFTGELLLCSRPFCWTWFFNTFEHALHLVFFFLV